MDKIKECEQEKIKEEQKEEQKIVLKESIIKDNLLSSCANQIEKKKEKYVELELLHKQMDRVSRDIDT